MANITTEEFYQKIVENAFDKTSYTQELEGNGGKVTFVKGSKVVKVQVIETEGAVTDHDPTNTLAQNISKVKNSSTRVNSYTMDQMKDIMQFIDKTYLEMTNSAITASSILDAIYCEQIVPMIDAYRLGVLATIATTHSQVVEATTNGMKDLHNARKFLVNARLNSNMIGFVSTDTAGSIFMSGAIPPSTTGLEQSLRKGDIGMLLGIKIKEVPVDILPTKVGAVIVNSSIVSSPRFIDDYGVSKAPVAFGDLALGLYVYTCVIAEKQQKGVAIIKSK